MAALDEIALQICKPVFSNAQAVGMLRAECCVRLRNMGYKKDAKDVYGKLENVGVGWRRMENIKWTEESLMKKF